MEGRYIFVFNGCNFSIVGMYYLGFFVISSFIKIEWDEGIIVMNVFGFIYELCLVDVFKCYVVESVRKLFGFYVFLVFNVDIILVFGGYGFFGVKVFYCDNGYFFFIWLG